MKVYAFPHSTSSFLFRKSEYLYKTYILSSGAMSAGAVIFKSASSFSGV